MVIRTDCRNLCAPAFVFPLTSPPCYNCGPGTAPIPPVDPEPPVVVDNAPPAPILLDPVNPSFFNVGTGIPAEFATSATDTAIELVLAPIIPHSQAVGPSVSGTYELVRAPGQGVGMVFGAALVSGANIKITDFYDVTLTVEAASGTVTLTLLDTPSTLSGYTWSNGAGYDIVDSSGLNGMTVENVTRLSFLIDAGLPPTANDDGTSVWTLEAVRTVGGATTTVVTTVNVTTTP